MITDYASLLTQIAGLLVREDLTDDIPGFVQLLEARLKDDPRARKLQDRANFAVSADGVALPSDFQELESWAHDGPTYFGPIHITGPESLPELKARCGLTGPPAYAAIIDSSPTPIARFAPVPDDTYTTKMTYWRTITPLSATVTTNWLLLERPDIYLYGSALAAAPRLRDDERVPLWEGFYNQRMDELDAATERKRFGGQLRRHVTPMG